MEIIVITLKHPNPVTAREVAENGEAWLDEIKPGWPSLIDKDRLLMTSTRYCVAGQVFAEEGEKADTSGYDHLYDLLVDEGDDVRLYSLVSQLGFTNGVGDWTGLDQAWRKIIERRSS